MSQTQILAQEAEIEGPILMAPEQREVLPQTPFSSETMYQSLPKKWLPNKGEFRDRLIVNAYDGVLSCYDSDFKKVWQFMPEEDDNPSNGRNQFYYKDGAIFTAYLSGLIYAIHTTDGSIIWQGKIGMGDKRVLLRGQNLTPYKGDLFVSALNSQMYCLEAETGAFVWKYDLEYPHNSWPAIAFGGKVYLPNAPYIYNFATSNGKALFARGFSNAMYARPVTNGKLLIAGDTDGNVYGLDPEDTHPIWEKKLPYGRGYGNTIFEKDNMVYLSNSNGDYSTIFCLDAPTGDILWERFVPGLVKYITMIEEVMYGYTNNKVLFSLDPQLTVKTISLKYQPHSNVVLKDGYFYYFAREGLVRLKEDLQADSEELRITYDPIFDPDDNSMFSQIQFTE